MNLLSNSRQQTGTQKYVVQPPLRIKGDNWQTMFGLSMCVSVCARVSVISLFGSCMYVTPAHIGRTCMYVPIAILIASIWHGPSRPVPFVLKSMAPEAIYMWGGTFSGALRHKTPFFRYDTLIYRIVSYRKRVFCAPTLHNGPLVSAEVACL